MEPCSIAAGSPESIQSDNYSQCLDDETMPRWPTFLLESITKHWRTTGANFALAGLRVYLRRRLPPVHVLRTTVLPALNRSVVSFFQRSTSRTHVETRTYEAEPRRFSHVPKRLRRT